MALSIRWTDEALKDLEEIIEYLEEKWSEKQIQRFFARLEECLQIIRSAPHRQKNSLRKQGTKEYQHSHHSTIFYNYDSRFIYILRLWSNFKDPDKL